MTLRTIILCAGMFVAGAVGLFLILMLLSRRSYKRNGTAKSPEHTKKKGIGTMDVILVFVFLALTVFTVEMIDIFKTTGMEPSTLETCVFAALGGECGIMGWIKTTKDRYREREWQKQDEAEARRNSGNDREG